MFKLVVLSALLAVSAAAPGYLTGAHPAPLAYNVAAPAVHSYAYSAPAVVKAAPVVSYAAPAVAPVAYAAPAVAAVAYAAPAVATTITKQVHYASHPVVTGYNAQVIKPNLGVGLATPAEIVSQTKVVAPARSVQTITPQVTHIQPEAHIQKVAVDVPVHTPYVSQVEVRTPTVVAPQAVHHVKTIHTPAVAYAAPAVAYAAPAVHHVKTIAAPAVAYAAPAVAYAAPAVHHVKTIAAPAVAYGAVNYGYSGLPLAHGAHIKTVY